VAPDIPDPDPPEVTLVRDFEDYLAHFSDSKLSSALLEAFHKWQKALLDLPTRDLPLRSLANECHLKPYEKMRLLLAATYSYMKCGGNPIKAFLPGCKRFPNRGTPIAEGCGELSRFIDFERARDLLPMDGPEGLYFSLDGDLNLWKDRLNSVEVIRETSLLESLEGYIQGGEIFKLFATLSRWVDDQKAASSEELAEMIRDKLGLPHLEEACVLEIRIPEKAVRSGGNEIRKPTFADAGGYPPFLPSRLEDEYGLARDLASDDLETRGGPEVWHHPVEARLASGLRYLGQPKQGLRNELWKAYNAASRKGL
jgi:hypothetical protein